MEQKLYTIKQTSTYLGVHPDTLRNWERNGHIIPIRIGARRDRRYTKEMIDSIMTFKQ